MNFFFGLSNEFFKSRITIPKFQNSSIQDNSNLLFEATIRDNQWKINEVKLQNNNKNFFVIQNDYITNDNIFFISNPKNLKKTTTLLDFDNFTDTTPAFRCNFEVFNIGGGFSSYQSEYPFNMTLKKGSIVSSLHALLNKQAKNNYLLIKNIFHEPITEKSKLYFVDIKKNQVLDEKIILSNTSNFFKINNNIIKPEIYLYTETYLGIPIFISEENNHISMEHTHPPHEYILSKNRFQKISNFKDRIYEIIKK